MSIVTRVPYAAVGDLRYGGRLHGLMAGSVFAGLVNVEGYALGDCGVLLAVDCRSCTVLAEVYYVDAWALREVDSVLEGYGAARVTGIARHGGRRFHVELHSARDCRRVSGSGWARLLLVLPPLLPPPVQPIAVYTVEVSGLSVCGDGRLFCSSPGSRVEAAAVDVYLDMERLASWAEDNEAKLEPIVARDPASGLPLYVHAPMARQGSEGKSLSRPTPRIEEVGG